jgi:hypothetical protein
VDGFFCDDFSPREHFSPTTTVNKRIETKSQKEQTNHQKKKYLAITVQPPHSSEGYF